ncbi:hypothetical protein [Devosia sp. 1566]|uniref:hypothetical protein n=1 Tax=Devosia sp. 1566 TaxID=2499144 RepID=UPI000FDAD6F6|nr:hypothetical protein [Devosia sp. 1566]
MSARSWGIDGLKAVCAAEKVVSDNPEWETRKHNAGREVHFTRPLGVDGEVKLGLRINMKGPELVRPGRPFLGLTALMFATRTAFVVPGLWMEEPPCSTTIV